MLKHTILVILLLCSITSISQNCNQSLSGSVVDLHDGSSLSDAILIVVGFEKVVVTDQDGKFTIQNLCDGTYSIQVSHSHCLTEGFRVRVSGNTSKTFRLEHHIEELNQVIVEGNAFGKSSESIAETTLTKEAFGAFS